MITFQLPADTVQFIMNKLDQVGGTRPVCNFFETEIHKYNEAQKTANKPEDNGKK